MVFRELLWRLPCFNRQVVLRGVGHAALHNPGEVNLCVILQSSIVYDQRLRDRTMHSKEAKKSSKRWKKVSASSMPDDSFPPIGCSTRTEVGMGVLRPALRISVPFS